MSKIDKGSAVADLGTGLVSVIVIFLIISAFFTVGLSLILGYGGYLLYNAYSRSSYKYCPICFTPFSKPKGEFSTDFPKGDRYRQVAPKDDKGHSGKG